MTLARLRDWALLILCNSIWASQFVMVKLVQREMGPVFATFFPMALATLLLVPFVRREQTAIAFENPEKRTPSRDILQFLLIGVMGQVVAQLFITWGTRLSLASNAALLMLTLPISTSVMAYLFLGERMTKIRLLSFALALAGVIECSGIDWKELDIASGRFLVGNLLIFLSVNGSAFYNAYSKRLLRRYSPLQVLLYSYYAVFVFMLPITLYVEPEGYRNLPHYGPVVWLGLAILTVFQYGLSMVIFLNVLSRLDATQVGLMNYLIPFFGIVIAAVVLGERLTLFMILGGSLVLASTLLVTVYEERQSAKVRSSSVESEPAA
jgi:drug/metabolite transporter (DMT)-like permease